VRLTCGWGRCVIGYAANAAAVTTTVWLESWSTQHATLPSAVGIELEGGQMLTVLKRGSALPATNSRRVTTSEDYQTVVSIPIFYGDNRQTEKNTPVDATILTEVPRRKQGEVEFELKLTVDVKGMVTLQAREVTSQMKWEDWVPHQRIRKLTLLFLVLLLFLLFESEVVSVAVSINTCWTTVR